MYLWKILQNVILSEQHLRTYRECIDLYMKVMCANTNNRDYFTGSRGDNYYKLCFLGKRIDAIER